LNTLDRLNAVIDYMENNITEKLDLERLATIACYSLYDFQRMFSFIAEMSIVEYVRMRRMTLAGLELQHSGAKVIDVALKYGYESPVSFARAFHGFHGISPSEAKKPDAHLKIFQRRIFQITINEVSQVIRKDKIAVNGKVYQAAYFGEVDISHWSKFVKREFWRLEEAYDDFKDMQQTGDVLPYNNFPINVEQGNVYVIDYTEQDGTLNRMVYIADGTVWEGLPSTCEIRIADNDTIVQSDKETVGGKEYDADYYGSEDISDWSPDFETREFLRLHGAFDDFKDLQKTGDVLPYSNYPMFVKQGQVFIIWYTKADGTFDERYYIADGTVWNGMEVTAQVVFPS